jgi:hypothetical protein
VVDLCGFKDKVLQKKSDGARAIALALLISARFRKSTGSASIAAPQA